VIVANKLHTAEQVTHFTAGGGCGGCIPKINELIAEVFNEKPKEEHKKPEIPTWQDAAHPGCPEKRLYAVVG
jgi:NAD(P)H-nitrite reductase large subunit